MKIAINDFGCIGRLVFRATWAWDDIEIYQVNDRGGDAQNAAYLLNFDSVQGTGDKRLSIVDASSTLVVDQHYVKVLSWYDNGMGYSSRLLDLLGRIGR